MLRKCLTQSIVFKSRNVVFIRRKEQKQHAMAVVCYSLCFPSEGGHLLQVDLNGHVFLCGHALLHQPEQSYISVVHI